MRRSVPWAIALVLMVLGFMLSMQMKVQKQVALKDETSFQRAEQLAAQLQTAEEERDKLMAETEDLRKKVRDQATVAHEDLSTELDAAEIAAGLIPLSGQGVVVTMTDSTRPLTPGENPNNSIIHDEDVLNVINELKASGAEAISINGQRLIGRSEIRCVGPTVTVNRVRTAPPIVITAIGPADEMENGLVMRGGIVESLKPWGIGIAVKKETQVSVPAYKGSLKLQYATPVKQEVSKP